MIEDVHWFVGIDWATQSHRVVLLDAEGSQVGDRGFDPRNGNRISTAMPAGGNGDQVQLTITTVDGREVIAAETRMK